MATKAWTLGRVHPRGEGRRSRACPLVAIVAVFSLFVTTAPSHAGPAVAPVAMPGTTQLV